VFSRDYQLIAAEHLVRAHNEPAAKLVTVVVDFTSGNAQHNTMAPVHENTPQFDCHYGVK
jgi:hypothetical protein